jgi:hypothetical protein
MQQAATTARGSNPFSTRFVRPGALTYRFMSGETLAELTQKLLRQNLRGAIVGPHGSGKSTLLAALLAELAGMGFSTQKFSLRDGQRRLPTGWRQTAAQGAVAVLAVDGYEQLSRWSRWRLDRYCSRQKLGLLVTAHGPTALAPLHETTPSVAIVESLAAELLRVQLDDAYRARIAMSCARLQGNIREVLFDLYDFYELRRATVSMPCD